MRLTRLQKIIKLAKILYIVSNYQLENTTGVGNWKLNEIYRQPSKLAQAINFYSEHKYILKQHLTIIEQISRQYNLNFIDDALLEFIK